MLRVNASAVSPSGPPLQPSLQVHCHLPRPDDDAEEVAGVWT